MAIVQKDGGAPAHTGPESSPDRSHFRVTPDNVLDIAGAIRESIDVLTTAIFGTSADLSLPRDAWLGDPVSGWAREVANDYFVHAGNSVSNILTQWLQEHQKLFTALRQAAIGYGLLDEWNARGLSQVRG